MVLLDLPNGQGRNRRGGFPHWILLPGTGDVGRETGQR